MNAKINKSPERGHRASLSLDRAYAYSLLAYVLPQCLFAFDAPHHRGLYASSLYSPTSTIASRHHHHHYQHPSFPSSPSTPLETIVEEDDSTAVNGKCQEKHQYPFLARPMWITSSTPGVTVRTGKLPLRPLLSMGEIGLPGDLEVRSITQIQIRERIAIDLGMVYRINSRSAPLSVSVFSTCTVSDSV